MNRIRTLLASIPLILCFDAASAATYSVGPGASCTHATVQAALDTAAATASASAHLVKLPAGELLVADLSVSTPLADIIIEGGYGNCAETAATGVTTLRKAAAPASARIFFLSNPLSDATPRRAIRLRRLTLTGATFTGALGGGAILAQGKIDLHLQGRVRIHDNQAVNGGGIYLLSLGSGESNTRLFLNGGETLALRPEITGNRAVGGGSNGNGGGITAVGAATITIRNGSVSGNEARRHGGGIALLAGSDARLQFDNITAIPIEVSDNIAGTGGFSETMGFGGAIYSEQATILSLGEEQPVPQLLFSGNLANHGGALYVEGAADARVPLEFRSSQWIDNVARGKGGAIRALDGVDLLLTHQQPGGFCIAIFLPIHCSRLIGNIAGNEGTPSSPGGGALHLTSGAELPAGANARARILRTIIDGNADLNSGRAGAIHAGARTSLEVEASVFTDNASGTGGGVIDAVGPETLLLRYNTLLDNDTARLVYAENQIVDLQGSALWRPGTTLLALLGTSVVRHNDCLLASSPIVPATHVVVEPPLLDSRHRPRGRSPAIDGCDNLDHAPVHDLYYNARGIDVAGVPNTWNGTNDLGAVEQHDVLYYGGFGHKRTN